MAKKIKKSVVVKNLNRLTADTIIYLNNYIASIDGTTNDVWDNKDNEQMADLFEGKVDELCRAIMWGDYRSSDRFYTIDNCANIRSFNDIKDWVDIEVIADWLIDYQKEMKDGGLEDIEFIEKEFIDAYKLFEE